MRKKRSKSVSKLVFYTQSTSAVIERKGISCKGCFSIVTRNVRKKRKFV